MTLSPPEATTAVVVAAPLVPMAVLRKAVLVRVVTVALEPTVDCRVMVKLGTLRVVRLPFTRVTTDEAAVASVAMVLVLPQGSVSVRVTRPLEPWIVEVTWLVSVSIMVMVVAPSVLLVVVI